MSPQLSPQSPPPLVSVVMTVYNGQRFLEQAVESILDQTFTGFEFIIVDDGSTDATPDILARYQARDPRIRLYRNPQNEGIPVSANRGCRVARGKYIAIMDADDVSLPSRLEKQVAYLERHPEVGLLGCRPRIIDEHGRDRLGFTDYATNTGAVKWSLFFSLGLVHPSVMMRRKIVQELGFYNPEFPVTTDYDLFLRASRVTRLANLRQPLLKFRPWKGSSTSLYYEKWKAPGDSLMRNALSSMLGTEVSETLTANAYALSAGKYPASLAEIRELKQLLVRLHAAFTADPTLYRSEIRAVSLDASLKLWLLASRTLKHSFTEAISLSFQAMRIHPLGFLVLSGKLFRRATTLISR